MMLINKKYYNILDEYIKKNIYYCLKIDLFSSTRENIKKDLYMIILCNKCKNFKNTHIHFFNLDDIIYCKYCKYKKCDYNKNYIKNLEIRIINSHDDINLKKDKYIEKIFSLSKINNLRLILRFGIYKTIYTGDENYRYTIHNHDFLENLLILSLSKTKNKVEIYSKNKDIKAYVTQKTEERLRDSIKDNINIKNENLKSLTMNSDLLKLRLKLNSLIYLRVYGDSCDFNNETHFDYIKQYSSSLEKIAIDDIELRKLFDVENINENIKTIKYINRSKKRYFEIINEMELLYKIMMKNKNIKNIELNTINKKYIKIFHDIPFVKNIIINQKYKYLNYLKKYNKIKFN